MTSAELVIYSSPEIQDQYGSQYESWLKQVLRHETGHLFGLDHATNEDYLMYYSIGIPEIPISNCEAEAIYIVNFEDRGLDGVDCDMKTMVKSFEIEPANKKPILYDDDSSLGINKKSISGGWNSGVDDGYLTYYMNYEYDKNDDSAYEGSLVVYKAFADWQKALGDHIKFSEEIDKEDANIIINFNQDGISEGIETGGYTETSFTVDNKLELAEIFMESLDSIGNTFYYNLAIHEIGRALGLDSSGTGNKLISKDVDEIKTYKITKCHADKILYINGFKDEFSGC
jgi:predicted Zn-dependent protease